jgi:3',5'-cyclic AMP phosphodiesterase CpdA
LRTCPGHRVSRCTTPGTRKERKEELMSTAIDRREFMQLAGLATAGIAGAVFASRVRGVHTAAAETPGDDFMFLQMSDTHWGFSGAAANPNAAVTLQKAVASVNALERQPDFIVFTGDLTHTTDDAQERRKRLAQFQKIVSKLKVKDVRFMAGEHDASLDNGEAYREFFGDLHYTFDHKGIHFIVLDNVSDPGGAIGTAQLKWLRADLAHVDPEAPIVVLTHRPLFDLAPDWDWATRDGAQAIQALASHEYVTVFYGHIHQEHHHQTGHIAHHAAKSLMFPLPAPGSVQKKAPIPWNPAKPYNGLGFRTVQTNAGGAPYSLTELPVTEV